MAEEMVKIRLSELFKLLLTQKSPVVEINGVTLVVEDYHLLDEKDIKPIGSGCHVILPVGLLEDYNSIFYIPGKGKGEYND